MEDRLSALQCGDKIGFCHFENPKIWVMLMDVFSGPPAPAGRRSLLPDFGLIAAIVAVALYALLIGVLILNNQIAPERAYWLLALPCLVPAVWYLYGFLRADGHDFGLILSSVGWICAALTFFLKHLSNVAALQNGQVPEDTSGSPLSYLFAFLAVAGIISGAVVSGQNWMKRNASGSGSAN